MIGNQTWSAVYDLYELLVEECNEEAEYQRYFEKHTVPFAAMGLGRPIPFEKSSDYTLPYDQELGYTPEPDFIAIRENTSSLVVFELKTPFVGRITTARKDGKRVKLSAIAESYVSQCTEYAESIKGRKEARDYLKDIYNLQSVSDVRVILIYALSGENDTTVIERLTASRKTPTDIVHYDVLLEMLADRYINETKIPVGKKGLTAIFHLSLSSDQINKKAIIAEGVSSTGDKLIIEYSGGTISFTIVSAKGKEKTLQTDVKCNVVSHVRIEFCSSSYGTFMSLAVDNMIQEIWLSKIQMDYSYNNQGFTLGASADGSNGVCCSFHEYYLLGTIMQIKDRLGSFHYFKGKKDVPGCVVFAGNQFLFKDSKNNLVQDIAKYRPRYHNPAQQESPTNKYT